MTGRGWLPFVAIAALALAASANSVLNGYTYDDVALIQNAPRIHSLDGWLGEFARTYWPEGDGYRPLTTIGWRAQWALGGGAPWVFHLVNVMLHVVTAVLVFWMARQLMAAEAAWIAAAAYAVHPVHVESIANVVGQSELVVALLVVAVVGLYLRDRARGGVTPRAWAAIMASYAVACFFKEHAIVLPALLVIAEATVVRDDARIGARLARIRLPLLLLALVASAYLLARSRVVVDSLSGFRPFIVFETLGITTTDRILTMIGATPEWVRLLLWPARLATQYSPPDIEVAQGVSIAQLPGLLILLGVLGLMMVSWRRSPVTAFGIGWLVITLLPSSNFVVPAGFIIAERTLLLPSVGAMIAVASGLWWLWLRVGVRRPLRVAALSGMAALLMLGVARSYSRNAVWQSDDRLWRQGVQDTPESYLAHFRLGLHLLSRNELQAGEAHYRRAIELFPHDPIMAYSFAEQLRGVGHCDAAMPIYRWLFTAWPESRRGHIGYAGCLLDKGRYDEARSEALVWIQRGGRLPPARQVLAAARAGRDSLANRR